MAEQRSGGTAGMVLHGYFRSAASYRVRLALNLKGLSFANVSHHLRKNEQREPAFLALNPQGLVPAFELNGQVLTQSLAICEFLDELHPEPPLLPASSIARAQVRAAAQVIACDTHPVQNLKILDRLRENGLSEVAVANWARTTIEEGLAAFAALLPSSGGNFCFGPTPGLADICLIPQLVNARRFGAEIGSQRILEIERACLALEPFKQSLPEVQPDAE